MSTHLFQIGDIVRINEPTLKQWAELRTTGYHEVEIAPYIGQFAVVVETWNDSEHVSDGCNLRICSEDYVFNLSDDFAGDDVATKGFHLTLVRESPLRTHKLGRGALTGLVGHSVPLSGSNTQRDIISSTLGVIPSGAIIESVRLTHRDPENRKIYIDCRVTLYGEESPQIPFVTDSGASSFRIVTDGDVLTVPVYAADLTPSFTTF